MSQLVAGAHKHFQQFSTVGGKSVRHGCDTGMIGGMPSQRWEAYPARWRASCVANPWVERDLVNVSTMFRAEVIKLRFSEAPTWASLAVLEILGDQVLDRSELFWGDKADEEPEHVRLTAEVRGGIRDVANRIRENETLRAFWLSQARAAAADPPGPKPGAVPIKVRIGQIADEILLSEHRPREGHGFKAELARLVHKRLQTEGLSYEFSSVERTLRDIRIDPPAERETG